MALKRSLTQKFTTLKRRVTPTSANSSSPTSPEQSSGESTPRLTSMRSSQTDLFLALPFEDAKEAALPTSSSSVQLDAAFEYFPAQPHAATNSSTPTNNNNNNISSSSSRPQSATSSRRSTMSASAPGTSPRTLSRRSSASWLNVTQSRSSVAQFGNSGLEPELSSTDGSLSDESSVFHAPKPSISSSVYSSIGEADVDIYDNTAADEMASSILEKASAGAKLADSRVVGGNVCAGSWYI